MVLNVVINFVKSFSTNLIDVDSPPSRAGRLAMGKVQLHNKIPIIIKNSTF